MPEFEYQKPEEPSYCDRLIKFEEKGVDRTNPRSVAEYTLLVNHSIAEGISDGSIDINKDNDAVELAWRNIAVLSDRIESNDSAIEGISQGQRDKIKSVDLKTGSLVKACGLEVNSLGGAHSLQGAINSGNRLPAEASGMVSLLLKESTDTFVEITSDPRIKIDKSLVAYFSGNTAGAAGWASSKLKLNK